MSAPTLDPAAQAVAAELGRIVARLDARLDALAAEAAVQRAQRERWGDLMHEVSRITGAGVESVSSLLADAEERGWFTAAGRGGEAAARMASAVAAGWDTPPPSARDLIRALRDPATRRGLARLLLLVRALGAPVAPPTPIRKD